MKTLAIAVLVVVAIAAVAGITYTQMGMPGNTDQGGQNIQLDAQQEQAINSFQSGLLDQSENVTIGEMV
jgi:cytochrome c biogenesis protein ResB